MKNIEERRLCITSRVTSILRYCAPLLHGQSEHIKSKFHTAMMRAYRVIYRENTYMTRCETICSKNKLPMPQETLAKATVKFIHGVITKQRPDQIFSSFKFPTRSRLQTAPVFRIIPRTERAKQGVINSGLKLYSTLNCNILRTNFKTFNAIISHKNFNILPPEEQRN